MDLLGQMKPMAIIIGLTEASQARFLLALQELRPTEHQKDTRFGSTIEIIDQQYQMALELEENRGKIKKIQEVFGQIPFDRLHSDSAQNLSTFPQKSLLILQSHMRRYHIKRSTIYLCL